MFSEQLLEEFKVKNLRGQRSYTIFMTTATAATTIVTIARTGYQKYAIGMSPRSLFMSDFILIPPYKLLESASSSIVSIQSDHPEPLGRAGLGRSLPSLVFGPVL
jgi:hypothetical protein